MPTLTILHGCRTIQLTCGFTTLIDSKDFAEVSQFKWHIRGTGDNHYATRSVPTYSTPKQKTIRLHRMLMGDPDGIRIDHRNGDPLDNRRVNLRLATPSQNAANSRIIRGKSRFKGVSPSGSKPNPWRVIIYVNGKAICIGLFPTEQIAARAYDEAAKLYFGEFAKTNLDMHGPY